jgi:8-oxo-dGTP pyrophosphatase MutT (NUDIX family)
VLRLRNIRHHLAQHRPEPAEVDAADAAPRPRRAAVALVLAGADDDLRLCFIRRAEHPADPWSGHMALPGGRTDPEDAGPFATAVRETREEVGVELEDEHLLGPLSEIPVRLGGVAIGLNLSGFVFYRGPEPPSLTPNYEVADAYWIPLRHLWDPENATHLELEHSGRARLYPAIRFRDHVIWGLTFRVLTLFSDVLDHPLPHLEDLPAR